MGFSRREIYKIIKKNYKEKLDLTYQEWEAILELAPKQRQESSIFLHGLLYHGQYLNRFKTIDKRAYLFQIT